MRSFILIFCFVLCIALRLGGLQYGLPYMLAPDENRQILDALGMLAHKTLIPHEYVYPALHKYLLMILYAFYFIFSWVFGLYISTQDFAFSFLKSSGPILLLSRGLSVFLGVGIMIWMYQIGKRFFSPWGSWLAMLSVGFSFHFIQLSQWALGDVVMVFCSLGCLYFSLCTVVQCSKKSLLLSALFLGLGISSKQNSLSLIGTWGISLAISFFTLDKLHKKQIFNVPVILLYGLLPLFLASLFGNIAWIFKAQEVLFRLKILAAEAQYSMASASLFSQNPLNYLGWFMKEVIRQENILGVFFLCGLLYGLGTSFKSKTNLLLTVSLILGALLCSRSSVRFVYHALPMYAIGFILSGAMLNALIKKYSRQERQAYGIGILGILMFISSVSVYWPITQKKLHPDTRVIAKEWIEKNIPYKSTIALDWYVFNAPIQTKIPPYFIHSLGLPFYAQTFDSELKHRYESYIGEHYYHFLLLSDHEEQERWSHVLPSDLRPHAEKIDILKRLYGRFLTPSLEELQTKNIDYVILSSYAYTHFLYDEDPHKADFFNPYFTEDTFSNHRLATKYDPQAPNRLLFFLIQHNRRFYHSFLEGKNPNIKLIHEFIPHKNFGPLIKIYKILQ